jgi:hypothetical protein
MNVIFEAHGIGTRFETIPSRNACAAGRAEGNKLPRTKFAIGWCARGAKRQSNANVGPTPKHPDQRPF